MRSYYARQDTVKAEERRRKDRDRSRKRRQKESYRQKQRDYYKEWYRKNGRKRSGNYDEAVVEWQQEHPDRVKASLQLREAVRIGMVIKPEQCEECHREIKLSGHHEDYSQPLKVRWLCSSCHKLKHTT